mgnify:CR=1 FL=1|jgi:molybdopterin converting factor small subunit|tara:strand:+ start:347 stop:937 length:591 start_codon:yes stop_codon:yes gene_type:complete
MAEVEVGGVKFRGGKIAIVLTALSTLGGAMWGGFEFYKDYMDMREKIETYVAPDLSNFDKRLGVFKAEMSALNEGVDSKINVVEGKIAVFEKLESAIQDSADSARDEARTIKRDLKGEIARTERLVESTEKRVKGIQDKVREMIDKENSRNDVMRDRINTRMDSLDSSMKDGLKALEKDVDSQIRKALENPLSKIK